MLNEIDEAFERRGFITYDALLETANDLKLSNPMGAARTLRGCHKSILRALDILERRAQQDLPVLYMIGGLRRYMDALWTQLEPDNLSCVLTHDDVAYWKEIPDAVPVNEGKLRALADLFLSFSSVVVAMQPVAERLIPERKGRDFARLNTPVLFIAYLTDAEVVPRKFIVEPVFSESGVVSEKVLQGLLEDLHTQLN